MNGITPDGRNIRQFFLKSTAHIGVFKHRRQKIGITIEVSVGLPSAVILTEDVANLDLIPDDHPSSGEEYSVLRDWIAEHLGERSVLEFM
jgi:hypothetical protein